MVSSSTTLSLSVFLYLSLFGLLLSPSESENKVSIELYYETLCPDSYNFILNELLQIFTPDIISIVDLKLIPWGNAKLRANDTFDCQHGPYECFLNTVEACAIDIWPELSKHFPFIYCVEELVYQGKRHEWESCFEKLNLDSKPIKQCYNSEHGKQLELQYAAETSALQPPHTYVPWVVVDGKPIYEDYEHFLSYICEAYKGTDTPQSCTKVSYLRELKAKPKLSVYNDEIGILTWGKVRSIIASWMHQMNLGGAI